MTNCRPEDFAGVVIIDFKNLWLQTIISEAKLIHILPPGIAHVIALQQDPAATPQSFWRASSTAALARGSGTTASSGQDRETTSTSCTTRTFPATYGVPPKAADPFSRRANSCAPKGILSATTAQCTCLSTNGLVRSRPERPRAWTG